MVKTNSITYSSSVANSFIKFEVVDVKEEVKEEIFDEDYHFIHVKAENVEENIKQEVEDPLS